MGRHSDGEGFTSAPFLTHFDEVDTCPRCGGRDCPDDVCATTTPDDWTCCTVHGCESNGPFSDTGRCPEHADAAAQGGAS